MNRERLVQRIIDNYPEKKKRIYAFGINYTFATDTPLFGLIVRNFRRLYNNEVLINLALLRGLACTTGQVDDK